MYTAGLHQLDVGLPRYQKVCSLQLGDMYKYKYMKHKQNM